MMTPQERYMTDIDFKVLVDYMTAAIIRCQYTPSEMREAAILASIRYEQMTVRPLTISKSFDTRQS